MSIFYCTTDSPWLLNPTVGVQDVGPAVRITQAVGRNQYSPSKHSRSLTISLLLYPKTKAELSSSGGNERFPCKVAGGGRPS